MAHPQEAPTQANNRLSRGSLVARDKVRSSNAELADRERDKDALGSFRKDWTSRRPAEGVAYELARRPGLSTSLNRRDEFGLQPIAPND